MSLRCLDAWQCIPFVCHQCKRFELGKLWHHVEPEVSLIGWELLKRRGPLLHEFINFSQVWISSLNPRQNLKSAMAFVDLSSVELTSSTAFTLVIFLCVVVLYLLHVYREESDGYFKFPPGPPGLPLLGNLLCAGKDGWFDDQVEKYGDMFTYKIGPVCIIYLHGKALREALNNSNVISDRAPIPTMNEYFKGNGELSNYLFIFFLSFFKSCFS